jgi:hypothetical protein
MANPKGRKLSSFGACHAENRQVAGEQGIDLAQHDPCAVEHVSFDRAKALFSSGEAIMSEDRAQMQQNVPSTAPKDSSQTGSKRPGAERWIQDALEDDDVREILKLHQAHDRSPSNED